MTSRLSLILRFPSTLVSASVLAQDIKVILDLEVAPTLANEFVLTHDLEVVLALGP